MTLFQGLLVVIRLWSMGPTITSKGLNDHQAPGSTNVVDSTILVTKDCTKIYLVF